MTVAMRAAESPRRKVPHPTVAATSANKVTPIARAKRPSTGATPLQNQSHPATPSSVREAIKPPSTPEVAVLKVLPSSQTKPLWLQSLLSIQRFTAVASFLLLGSTLTVYAWTVYGQQRWSEEYHKLETLRRNEQQLTAASEVLKHQIAVTAENPDSGLAPQQPTGAIFLNPAPPRPAPQAPIPLATPTQKTPETPLGY